MDGDDYVEPSWLSTAIQTLQDNVQSDPQLGALTVAHSHIRSVMFDAKDDQLLCQWFPPIQASGKQASLGLLTAIRRDVWNEMKSKFTAVDGPHFKVFQNLGKAVAGLHHLANVSSKLVHYEREKGMYTITRLSAHFNWHRSPTCAFQRFQWHYKFDVRNVVKEIRAIPNISELDACQSDIFFKGNHRGMFKGKSESCQDMWNRKINESSAL